VANEQRLLDELSASERAKLAGLLEKLAISRGDDADARIRAGRRVRNVTQQPGIS
jgi:hypothetical protein